MIHSMLFLGAVALTKVSTLRGWAIKAVAGGAILYFYGGVATDNMSRLGVISYVALVLPRLLSFALRPVKAREISDAATRWFVTLMVFMSGGPMVHDVFSIRTDKLRWTMVYFAILALFELFGFYSVGYKRPNTTIPTDSAASP